MTTAELERAAAAIVPPVGAGALCLVTGGGEHRVAFVINGRGKVAVGPGFAKPRDAARFMDLLAGDPAPRSAPVIPAAAPLVRGGKETGEPDQVLTGAPVVVPPSGSAPPVTTRAPREATDSFSAVASLGARVQPSAPRHRPTGRAIDLTPQG